MVATRLLRREADTLDISSKFTTFCVKKFNSIVFLRVTPFTIAMHAVTNSAVEGGRAIFNTDIFTLLYDDDRAHNTTVRRAVSTVLYHDVDICSYTLRYVYSCVFSQTTGILYAHLTGVSLQYQQYSAAFRQVRECVQTRQLDVSRYFYMYCNRDMSIFTQQTHVPPLEGIQTPATSCSDVEGSDRKERWERVVRLERARHSKYSLSSNLHDLNSG